MSHLDLLHGRFAPFLLYEGYDSIRHLVPQAAFRTATRVKALAVSDNGKTLRMVLKPDGYHDHFVLEDSRVVLVYVCGLVEEQRRQNLNRPGDEISRSRPARRLFSLQAHGL